MTPKTKKKSKPPRKKSRRPLWYLLLLIALLCTGGYGVHYYRIFFLPNVTIENQPSVFIYIHTGSDFAAVKNLFSEHHYLNNYSSFETVAEKKKYDIKIKPGRYRIHNGMSNNELVDLLRSGKQEPVKLIVQNVRTPEDLAGRISTQIESDSISILNLLQDPEYLRKFGVIPSTVFSLFIPNTYELFWNTSADQFIQRMYKERQKFWNDERVSKMSLEGLDIPGVVTLASILEKETSRNAEKPVIAGIYLNRLRKGWHLQADPTLIFAWNDYTIKRVLNKHKEIESPYNTYKIKGLPPGPICLPSVASIDAVLNYDHNDYMYFCAKDDLSGYHNFAITLTEHNRNAEKYQLALKRLKIH
jgi:UPF0755 protein